MNLISRKLSPIRGGLGDFVPSNLHEQGVPTGRPRFIHIYGDLSYARKAGTATLLFFFFLAFCHHQPFRPIEFYFRSWAALCAREFGDHKYRNGHGSPLKDAGERRTRRNGARRSSSSRGVIGKKSLTVRADSEFTSWSDSP